MATNLFYNYYDRLFKAKDYSKETQICLELSEKYGLKNPQTILEIGCGTGNHTINLAQTKKKIIAIDTDPKMINKAAQKIKKLNIKNVKLLNTRVEDLKNQKFDLIIAMFNVITYIEKFEDLESFINSVGKLLKKDGVFIFDCWNGVAVMIDPPKVKKVNFKNGDEKLSLKITPNLYLFNQLVKLTYDFQVNSKDGIKKDTYILPQKLWTPDEINWILKGAGFETKLISPILNTSRAASAKDWKIQFCAKR